jgi:ParB family chromosome partitioning protein
VSLEAALDTIAPAKPKQPTSRPAPGTPAAQQVSGLTKARTEDLIPNPANPRQTLTEITELADSIRENGLIQPIIVRPDPQTGARHRRRAPPARSRATPRLAARRGHRPPEMRDVDDLVAALVENGQRAGLDPIEEARALNALKVRDGLSDFEIGKKVGRSQPVVSGRIALLALSPAEQEELRAGHMRHRRGHPHRPRQRRHQVGAAAIGRGWHLNPSHPLAGRAKVRCEQRGPQGRPRHRRRRPAGPAGKPSSASTSGRRCTARPPSRPRVPDLRRPLRRRRVVTTRPTADDYGTEPMFDLPTGGGSGGHA